MGIPCGFLGLSLKSRIEVFPHRAYSLLQLIGHGVGLVVLLDGFLFLFVFLRVGLGVFHHSVHFTLIEVGGAGDGNLLFLSGIFILSGHV